MREYELTVVYDLAVAEAGGPDAGVQQLTGVVEGRGGKVLKVDHWGRRRMAYPIKGAIDGDYVVTRIELDPTSVSQLETVFRLNEKVYRHLVVRADELPPPPPERPHRAPPPPVAAAAPAPAPVAEPPPAPAAAEPAPSAEAPPPLAAAEEAPEPATGDAPAPAPEATSDTVVEAAAEPAEPATAEEQPAGPE
jgi:small subunit ribosomal protein S6